jgi:hypothetical protein
MTIPQTELANAFGDSFGALKTLLSPNDQHELLVETRNRVASLIRDRSAIEERTRRETGAATATNEVDRLLAATITRGKHGKIDASLLARAMAGLSFIQKSTADARGGMLSLSNKYVFTKVATLAHLPLDAVLAIPDELMSRMRALT